MWKIKVTPSPNLLPSPKGLSDANIDNASWLTCCVEDK